MDGQLSVTEAVQARYSCRAFLERPVPRETVAEILEAAVRAPSGGNLQPWHVDVLAGGPLAALKAKVAASLAAKPEGEGAEFAVYPRGLEASWRERRFACGEQLYASIRVPRENRPARLMQFARNFDLFGAPVGLFFSIPRHFGPPQWSHLGMFIQTIMLLAAERRLATCAQEAWAIVHKTVGQALRLPPERLLTCGMALGYADEAHPINQWRTEREPLEAFATFNGF